MGRRSPGNHHSNLRHARHTTRERTSPTSTITLGVSPPQHKSRVHNSRRRNRRTQSRIRRETRSLRTALVALPPSSRHPPLHLASLPTRSRPHTHVRPRGALHVHGRAIPSRKPDSLPLLLHPHAAFRTTSVAERCAELLGNPCVYAAADCDDGDYIFCYVDGGCAGVSGHYYCVGAG